MTALPPLFLGVFLAFLPGIHAAPPALDEHTLFALETSEATKTLVDLTGHFTPTVSGGSAFHDEERGWCLQFGEADKNGVTLKDDGKLSFAGGMTLEATVYLEEPPPKGAVLALKVGSFAWDIAKGKLNTAWMVFPTEEVATDEPRQYKYFPVGGDTINGLMTVPLKKWVRLTMAYDEALGEVITTLDGMTDRQRYRYRGPERLQSDGKSALTLFLGFKNCRLGPVRLRQGRPRGAAPSLEVYANALPFEEKVLVTLDHIDPALKLPLEVTIISEKASGSAETVKTLTLASHAKADVLLDAPTWKNSLHTLTVNVTSEGRAVLSKNLRLASVKPAGPTMILPDHTIAKDGKRFFPLMVYHALPAEFPRLAEVGFNIVFNDYNLGREGGGRDPARYDALLAESLDAAQKSGLYFITATNSTFNKLHTIPVAKAHPAMLLWYGADEPWGDLTRLTESYNTIKMLEPNLPVLIIQNNYSRLQDTAPGADILATDPYPVPNVSLRGVADATLASLRAVSGKKPVWTILPQYESKIPTRAELRCMAWLAIASGAKGLGFYSWDDQTRDPQTGALKGWHTADHPEQVEDLRTVLAELRAQEPLLLAPEAATQPRATPPNPALHFLLKEADGKRYLMIANDSRRDEETMLKWAGVDDADAANVLEPRSPGLRVRKGEAALKMPPLGVAVYEVPH